MQHLISRIAWSTYALCITLFSLDSLAETYSFSIVGGGEAKDTMDSFYENGATKFHNTVNALGINKANQNTLFGRTTNEVCYSKTDEDAKKAALLSCKAFMQNKKCEDIDPILDVLFGKIKTNLICHNPAQGTSLNDLDKDGKDDIHGASNLFNIEKHFEELLKKASRNDHVLLSLSNHGLYTGESAIILGTGDFFSETQLGEWLTKLKNKGVTVHLETFSCYSGGFNSLTDVSSGSGKICSLADADPNLPGYAADGILISKTFDGLYYDNLKKYGNQLQAFACSLGADSVNRSNTSLDVIVKKWMDKAKIAKNGFASLNQCPKIDNLAEVSIQIEKVLKVVNPSLNRKKIIQAYNDYFVKTLSGCSLERAEGDELMNSLNKCLYRAKIDEGTADFLKKFLKSARAEKYDLELINQHLSFLNYAPEGDLREYVSAFCCLSYDFKNPTNKPEICD